MKIGFYNHTGQVSGAEYVLFSILSGLDQTATSAFVLAPESERFRSVCESAKVGFHPVRPLQARYTSNPFKFARYCFSIGRLMGELRKHIRREKPDLIHANSTRSAVVATLATIGFKTQMIWHVHDMMPKHPISSVIRLLAALSGRNRIVAVSHATGESFVANMPKQWQRRAPVEVVYNGTDIDLFTLGREGTIAFLEKIGLNVGHFRIGIVGQITPRKGHLEIIRCLAPSLRTSLQHARILIAGTAMFNNDKAYLELLKAESRRLGVEDQVLFLGACHAPTIMKALDVLVLNSSNEPFGLVVTEAMASGTPVLAAAVDGVPEIIENGVSGLLFSPGDFKTFVSHLHSISENKSLAATLVEGGRARVTDVFSLVRFQSQFRSLYKSYSLASQAE